MKDALNILIDNIPAMLLPGAEITMNRECYTKLCEELNREVKTHRKIKINTTHHDTNGLLIAHHKSAF